MKKEKAIRSARHRPEQLNIGELAADFVLHSGERGSGRVVDFSGEGVGMAVDSTGDLYLPGDAFPQLRVHRGGQAFFEGSAVVRNLRESNGSVVVGLAFQNAWMDLPKLYEVDLKTDLEQRFTGYFGGLDRFHQVPDDFKAWVADVRYFLDTLREKLNEEEARICDLDALTRESVARETVDIVSKLASMHLSKKFDQLNRMVQDIDPTAHDMYRAYFQHHLHERLLGSPFFRRCYNKPLGYAGDYEIMNMIYSDHRIGNSLYDQVVSVFAMGITAAQAVANRVPFLSDRILEIMNSEGGTRIASIACGPAREIARLVQSDKVPEGLRVTLLDIDINAIRYCEKVLLPLVERSDRGVQIRFVQESVREIIRRKKIDSFLEPQDVILSVGLFDYFGDRLFRATLGQLYALLKPGGHLFVGNFGPKNDSRFLMEYVAEWFLVHRTADELRELTSELPGHPIVTVDQEPTGANLFLCIRKPS